MSIESYPFEEKAAVEIDPFAAAAIILMDTFRADPSFLPDSLRQELESGVPYWKAAQDEKHKAWLNENSFFNVSDAFDILENAETPGLVHCSEFYGSGSPADGFENVPGNLAANASWSEDFVCFLVHEKDMGLFHAAYPDGPQSLIDEYRNSLEPFLGPGYDYAHHIMDVTGVYYA